MSISSVDRAKLSWWWSDIGDQQPSMGESELPGESDIVIVGAGYTGLWTAYYLKQRRPDLDITIIDAEIPGFGASGRNGGWCMGETSGLDKQLDNPESRPEALRLQNALFATVEEVERVCIQENIDCHYQRGGSLHVAPSQFHAERLVEHVRHRHAIGVDESDLQWLDGDQSQRRVGMRDNFGAVFTPHCAAIHPLRLVNGLVKTLHDKQVRIIGNTAATEIQPGLVRTERGDIRCEVALRATEAYTDTLTGQQRKQLPVFSLMVITEPLGEQVWSQLGMHSRETVGLAQRMVTYAQRTIDGRMAFGARGGYLYGSGLKRHFTPGDPRLDNVALLLRELFPALRDSRIEHAWGGMLGVPRSWSPVVDYDPLTGLGWAGGYVGEGVAASNLAGRTLADLVAREETELTSLPWVRSEARRWEPEPLRWTGYKLAEWAGVQADQQELTKQRPAGLSGKIYDLLSG